MSTVLVFNHSIADIVRQLLTDLGVGSEPPTTDPWPIYESSEPNAPDDVITVYDTSGVMDGRVHYSGEMVEHPGVQIRIRSTDKATGNAKAHGIKTILDTQVLKSQVTLDTDVYFIQSITRTTNVISIGKQVPTSLRNLFTINATVSIKVLSN